MLYSYAPLPAADYFIPTLDVCEVRSIMRLPEPQATAAWNLFWLTEPRIDRMPALGNEWWQEYIPKQGLAAKVMSDVIEDEALYRKLLLHPSRFHEFFLYEPDLTIYDTYEIVGESWRTTVLRRAAEAAARIDSGMPKIGREGNVIYPNWFQHRSA